MPKDLKTPLFGKYSNFTGKYILGSSEYAIDFNKQKKTVKFTNSKGVYKTIILHFLRSSIALEGECMLNKKYRIKIFPNKKKDGEIFYIIYFYVK